MYTNVGVSVSLTSTCSSTVQHVRDKLKRVTSFIEDTVIDYDKYMSLLVKIRLEYALMKLREIMRELETLSNT
jgi:hypothetical protein